MSENTRRRAGTVALLLGFAVLYLIIALTALNEVGTDPHLYYSEQMKVGVLPGAGISETDLRMLDGELAKYLAGRSNELILPSDTAEGAYTVQPLEIDGELRPAFNEKELAHLRDCLGLFDLLRKVRGRLIPWAILLTVGGAYLLQDRRRARLCAWLSPLIVIVPIGAFAAWAATNFDAAFVAFHRLFFKNNLWLLNPATDLLIRVCPQSMFAHMGACVGVISLAGIIAVSAAATALTFIWPKRKEDNTWNNRDMRRASGQKQVTFGKTGMR